MDITTRQNIQIRGVQLEDAPKIIDGLHARGQTSFRSNPTPNPSHNPNP